MNNLVFINNGKTVTDSLTVAEVFGKEHKHVMRDIRNLGCSKEFSQSNFGLTSYQDSMNRTLSKYIITEQGFAVLAMGYTGKEAMRFKEQYIAEFERMREQLNHKLPSSPLKALMQATHNILASQELIVERMDEIEGKLESQITLDSGQQRRLQKAVSTKVYSIATDQEERSKLYRQLYKEIKDRWGVPSYKDVLRQDMQGVLQYIAAWVPVRRAG